LLTQPVADRTQSETVVQVPPIVDLQKPPSQTNPDPQGLSLSQLSPREPSDLLTQTPFSQAEAPETQSDLVEQVPPIVDLHVPFSQVNPVSHLLESEQLSFNFLFDLFRLKSQIKKIMIRIAKIIPITIYNPVLLDFFFL